MSLRQSKVVGGVQMINICLRKAHQLSKDSFKNEFEKSISALKQKSTVKQRSRALPNSNHENVSDSSTHPPVITRKLHNQVAVDGLRSFIEKVTSKPKEARMWLKYFAGSLQTNPGKPFAVLHVTEEVFTRPRMLEMFAWSAAFLVQNKMKPVLVFGPSVNLNSENVKTSVKNLASILENRLREFGVESNLFMADNNAVYVTSEAGKQSLCVANDMLRDCLLSERLPLITNLVVDRTAANQEASCWNSVQVAEAIAKATKPMKTMFLGMEKGLHDKYDKVVSDVTLPADLVTLQKDRDIGEREVAIVKRVWSLLENLPSESSVILTSADNVIQELFTHHGAGTMFKRSERLLRFSSLSGVNVDRLSALIEASFGRKLCPGYWTDIEDKLEQIYLSENYSAAAIILRDPDLQTAYLDKIGVLPRAQGSGISATIWNEIVKDYSSLFWRSRRVNSYASSWYYTVSQGSWKSDIWTIFWYGLSSCHDVYPLVDYALRKPDTFMECDNEETNRRSRIQ